MAAGTRRIAVGMSGGVDSAVAAALLQEQGYEVIGLTGRMWGDVSRCCSAEDILRAKETADFLGIPHYVLDLSEKFRTSVVDYFVSEYTHGRTPSPCLVCNREIKFGLLMEKAMALGAIGMATGHYVRTRRDEKGGMHLHAGADPQKDQSYFLAFLTQDQLRHAYFPVGDRTKPEVRAYAAARNFPLGSPRESQELCFVTEGHHYELTEALCPDIRRKGDIVDVAGRKLGEHEGLHRYTIGQRKGIGVASGAPLYVVRLDTERNELVLGERERMVGRKARVGQVHWMSGKLPEEPFRARIRIRYKHEGADGLVIPTTGNTLTLEFDEPQFAITPGQAAVFYAGDEVLGGGWIDAG